MTWPGIEPTTSAPEADALTITLSDSVYNLLRCGLGGKPLSSNIWTHGCWIGYTQAEVLPQVLRRCDRTIRDVRQLVSVGGIANQGFPASL